MWFGLCTCLFNSNSHKIVKTPYPSTRIALFNKKSDSSKVTFDKVVIPGNYNVAAGFLATAALSGFCFHNAFAAVPLALIGAFIFRQTGRVCFVFDNDSMEVCYVDKEAPDGIKQSRENFAVGGQNRWTYKSFKNWYFVPSKEVPVLMYFSETQTKPEGQFHLFPVIMDSKVCNTSCIFKDF